MAPFRNPWIQTCPVPRSHPNMHKACTGHTQRMHAPPLPRACSVHNVCVQCAQCMRARVQCAQYVHAVCTMQTQCQRHARAYSVHSWCVHATWDVHGAHGAYHQEPRRDTLLLLVFSLMRCPQAPTSHCSGTPTQQPHAQVLSCQHWKSTANLRDRQHCFEKRSQASCIMHHGLQPQQNHQPPQRQAKPPLEWRDGTGGQKLTDTTVIFQL